MHDQLKEAPAADLAGATRVAELAEREGFDDVAVYSLGLFKHLLGHDLEPTALDAQRDRLRALADIAQGFRVAQATADELAAHYAILNALMLRFSLRATSPQADRQTDNALKWADAALRCQRAAQKVLGALHVLSEDARLKAPRHVEQQP